MAFLTFRCCPSIRSKSTAKRIGLVGLVGEPGGRPSQQGPERGRARKGPSIEHAGGARATGNHVFDGHIVVLSREHGIDEILTADADFHRFEGIRVVDSFRS